MSDLRTDETLGARIRALELEVEAGVTEAQGLEAAERAVAIARSSAWTLVEKKRAALEELRATWDARGLPPRTVEEVPPE